MTIKELFKLGINLIQYYFSRPNTEISLIETFLDTKIGNIEKISNSHPNFLKGIIAYAVDCLLKECKIEKVISIDVDYIGVPQYETFEISISEKKSLPVDAGFYIQYKNTSLILKLALNNFSRPIFYEVQYAKKCGEIAKEFVNKLEEYIKTKNFLRNQIITPDGKFVKVDNYSFNDLVIPKELKDNLQMNILTLFDKKEIYKINDIPIRRGILFAGKFGTGKTLALKIISKLLKTTVIWVTASSVNYSKDIRNIFEMARELAPTVILFEDIDLYCRDREEEQNLNPILGEFLNCLDGLEENNGVITLATTNYPQRIEKALKDRHNRFDKTLTFELPNEECRRTLIERYLKNVKTKDIEVEQIVRVTKDYSGAQIKELITVAKFIAVEAESLDKNKKIILKMEHITESLSKVPKVKSNTCGFTIKEDKYDDM